MKITSLFNRILYEEDKDEGNKVINKVDEILKDEEKTKNPKKDKKVKKDGMFAKEPQKKEKGIKVFYSIKSNITDTASIMDAEANTEVPTELPPETPATAPVPETPVAAATPETQNQTVPATNPLLQSTILKGLSLNEESYSFNKEGELTIPVVETAMISSLESLIDYLSQDKASKKGAILDEVMSNVLMIASGINGAKQLTSIIKKEDYIYCSMDFGNSVEDSIGILLRKVAGVNLVSLNLKKDGNILAAFSLQDFNSELIRYINDLKSEIK